MRETEFALLMGKGERKGELMDATMTLRGRVGTDLHTSRSKTGALCVRFRLAVSQWRRTDSGNYEELGVRWYSVRAWGRLAEYVLPSVRKGDPLVIVGRPTANAWTDGAGEIRSDLVFNAVTIGHDLNFGTSNFRKGGGSAPVITEPAYLSTEESQISISAETTPPGSEFRVEHPSEQVTREHMPREQVNRGNSVEHESTDSDLSADEGVFHDAYMSEDKAALRQKRTAA